MQFQEIVHAVELGEGKKWIRRVVILIGFIGFSFLYFVTQFRGFGLIEAMDTAQLGRQIEQGKGYTTEFLRPSSIAQCKQKLGDKFDLLKMPETLEPPLFPSIVSLIIRLPGVKIDEPSADMAADEYYSPERAIVIFNFLCLFLTAGVIFFWAGRMFDQRVALIATLCFVLCDLMWQFAISGLSTSFILLLMTCFMAAVHEILWAEEKNEERKMFTWVGIASLLFLLMLWTRMSIFWMVIPYFLLLLFLFKNRPLLIVIALAIILIGITPWLYRNYAVSGNIAGDTFSLMKEDGQDLAERSLAVHAEDDLKLWLNTLPKKLLYGFRYHFTNGFQLLGASVAAFFFFCSLVHPFRRRRVQLFRFFIIGTTLFLIAGASFFRSEPPPVSEMNFLILLWPAITLIGTAFFYVLIDRIEPKYQIWRFLSTAGYVVLTAFPLLVSLTPPRPMAYHYPPYFPPVIKAVGRLFKPTEVMMSDVPWATAWYGDRVCLWVPETLQDFYTVNDSIHPIVGFLLTPYSWQKPLLEIDRGPANDWAGLIRRQKIPTDFPLSSYTPLPPNKDEYALFSDHIRW